MKTFEELLDQFAGQALTGLISKLPLLDIEGEHGTKATPEEIAKIKKEIAKSAYEYASYMLIARNESIEWLNRNKHLLINLGEVSKA